MQRLPVLPTAAQRERFTIGGALLIWLSVSAYEVFGQLDRPRILGMSLCALIIFAPLVLRKIAKLPVYLLAAFAAIVPFDELLATGAGGTLTKLLGLCIIASLAISLVTSGRSIKPSRTLMILLALAVYAGASIVWAIDPAAALSAYGKLLQYVALFAAVSLYPVSWSDVKIVLFGLIAGGVAAGCDAIWAFNSMGQFDHSRLYLSRGSAYVIDPNEFAASLLLPTAITAVLFLRAPSGREKLLWLVTAIPLFCGLALSGSRAATIALGIYGAFLLLRSRYKLQIIVAACIAFAAGALYSPVAQRFAQPDAADFGGRGEIWKVGLAALHKYWMFGAGIGNFTPAYDQFFLRVPHLAVEWERAAHNVLLQAAVEYGLIGCVLLIAVWLSMFRELAHTGGDGDLISEICTGISGGVLAIFVAGFSLSLMDAKFTWLAFCMVALMRSLLITSGREAAPNGAAAPRPMQNAQARAASHASVP